jgi:hypothetical protein
MNIDIHNEFISYNSLKNILSPISEPWYITITVDRKAHTLRIKESQSQRSLLGTRQPNLSISTNIQPKSMRPGTPGGDASDSDLDEKISYPPQRPR